MAVLRSQARTGHPPPTAAWLEPPNDDCPTGVIVVTDGKGRSSYYDLVEVLCQFEGCRGFSLTKFSPDRPQYHVLLGCNDQDCNCDCPGFSRWSHCKHVSGVRSLIGGDL
jgi:hypothetical protein